MKPSRHHLDLWPRHLLRWYRLIGYQLGLWQRLVSLFLVSVSVAVTVAACSGGASSPSSANAKKDVDITLVSFAVTKAAHDAIIPKFQEKWLNEHGQRVTVSQSYGGSGTQTRAVIDGLEADIAHLALALDTNKLVEAGLVEPGWEAELPNNSIVSGSVAALVTREGNPKGINTWSDLAKDGVQLITADPKTSGVARWNFLALWNAAIKSGGDEAAAKDFLAKVYKNVPILTKDAREATDIFLKQGQGDALINYENEIILAAVKGEKAAYVIPEVNISIDNPITIVDTNVDKHGTREVAEAFVAFMFTPESQAEFAKVGFRPIATVKEQLKEFDATYPPVKTLGTVKDYGGWGDVQKKFFADGALFDQIQVQLNR